MTDDPRTEPLREWNRLARENTENAIVSSMFEAASKASEPIETFTTWLLVGTAAVASFLITNADKLLPLVKQGGFITCGAFLFLSCVFGLLAKMYGLRCKIAIDTGAAVRQTFREHLEKYEGEERKIKEGAKFWGINLQTGIRLERVLAEFYAPLPKWAVWLASRELKKIPATHRLAIFFSSRYLIDRAYLHSFRHFLSWASCLQDSSLLQQNSTVTIVPTRILISSNLQRQAFARAA